MKRMYVRFTSVLMTLILVFALQVPASARSPEDDLEDALAQLNYYLTVFGDKERSDDVSLEETVKAFKSLGSYSFASGFYQYSYILLYLEQGDYRAADIFKETLKRNERFQEMILSDKFAQEYPSISSVDELVNYVDARIAENSGDTEQATELYKECSLFFDANDRLMALLGGSSEQMYTKGQDLMFEGKYKEAYELFKELAAYGYMDSDLYEEICYNMLLRQGENPNDEKEPEVPEETPTVKATPTPTKKPAATKRPTVTPTKRPTATPTKKPAATKKPTAAPTKKPHSHTAVKVPGYAATCTKAGKTDGSKCSSCGEVLKKQTAIPALGHNLEHVDAKAPTKNQSGWYAYDKCKRCTYSTFRARTMTAGSWSGWSTTKVTESSTRDVETKTEQQTVYRTQYNYSHYKYYNTAEKDWYYSYEKNTNWYATQGKWEYYPTYTRLARDGDSNGHARFRLNGIPWYNETTKQVANGTQSVTYYRYRDYTE
ncbi:MAG: hypothetical protein K5663_06865 [Clostridiales bacterium]|nr:hypothetical protein [Clostridiales bacterium]